MLTEILDQETDSSVLSSIGCLNQHLREARISCAMLRHGSHSDSSVRAAVARGLAFRAVPGAIPVLLALCSDPDIKVRIIALQTVADSLFRNDYLDFLSTPEILDFLMHLTSDEWEPIRAMAMVGLANRGSPPVKSMLVQALKDAGPLDMHYFQAAETIGEPELLQYLKAHEEWVSEEQHDLACYFWHRAIEACQIKE